MARPTLLLLRPFAPRDRESLFSRLEPLYNIIEPHAYDDNTLAILAKNADVALGSSIPAIVFESATCMRLLQTPGAGLEKLDLAALAARRVIVCRSASHARQVAEHAIGMLLGLMRKIALHDRLLRAGIWYRPKDNADDELYQTDSLQGARIGLLGYGAINQALAHMLTPFDVQLSICTRSAHAGIAMASIDNMMRNCDAIVVAVPLTEHTRGLIGARQLANANPALYLVNVGRAEVVERQVLHGALANRSIRGAALDVPYEGVDGYAGLSDFAAFDNTLLSPHRAGILRGHSLHLGDVLDNLAAYAQGQPLKNVVNLEADY